MMSQVAVESGEWRVESCMRGEYGIMSQVAVVSRVVMRISTRLEWCTFGEWTARGGVSIVGEGGMTIPILPYGISYWGNKTEQNEIFNHKMEPFDLCPGNISKVYITFL